MLRGPSVRGGCPIGKPTRMIKIKSRIYAQVDSAPEVGDEPCDPPDIQPTRKPE
jgi:hypothetical protein